MSIIAAQQAIIRRLLTAPGRPNIVLPNEGGEVPLPRWVVQAGPASQRRATIGGTMDATLEIVVTVETAADAFATESDALVQQLVDRFPVDARFDGVRIMEPLSPRPALPGGPHHAVPVVIRGRLRF